MGESLLLKVLTPTGMVVDAGVLEVSVPGAQGEFGVLPGHTYYLAVLRSGRLSYRTEEGREILAIRDGLAEVNEDRVIVLTREARRPGEVGGGELEQREKEALRGFENAVIAGEPTAALQDELNFLLALKPEAHGA